ncbi:MAG: sugar ABC transporter permease [Acidobacteria bacterium]|nr:sugar ABC transporter permease [Acidobacteriota bacterium]
MLVIGLLFLLPIVAGLALSLTDFDIYSLGDTGNVRFVGLRNYVRELGNPVFWQALGNTFYFVLVGGPLNIAAALGAAMLLNSRLARFKGLFRTIYFAPVVTSLVAVAVIWRYIYHPRFGLLNLALGLVGIDPVNWLGDTRWAMPSIILLSVWKNFGYNMIIFVAGLQSIPEQLYEAARIDGAGPWRQFRSVTLPMLRPTLVFVGLITMIGYFQVFAEPYVMSGGTGGPLNSTLTVVFHMYAEGFRWWNLGQSAAIAFILFLVVLAATLVQLRLQRERP